MSLFLEAAKVWNGLQNTTYRITIGHKRTMEQINLVFRQEDFDHLSGIHYAADVDFKLHRRQYRGKKLVPMLLSKKLDAKLIEKSEQWNKISERLSALICLTEVLESDFLIYKFEPNKLPFHSEIKAAYCIYDKSQEKGVFLFLDQSECCYYCKSIFKENIRDYCINQTPWTVLKKEKLVDETVTVIYGNPSFKEPVAT